jgi:S-formylglutathione hydrolase FrmB
METTLPLRAFLLCICFVFLSGCLGAEPATTPAASATIAAASPAPNPTGSATPTATGTPLPVPTLAPTALPAEPPAKTATPDPCWITGGRIEHHQLTVEGEPHPWDFRVYTPPCYDSHTDRSYPLLVLIHGSLYTDAQWDDLGADEAADSLIGAGTASPFLILMPRDYVFVAPVRDPFDEALMTLILPWVEANYRTIPDRDHRGIGGLSRGASWAVHLGLQHWPVFSAIGAHSLPVFLKDPPFIPGWLEVIPAEQLPRIYLDIGEDDHLLDQAAWFEGLLTEMNIPHEWHLNSGRHDPAYWEAHMLAYMAWYAGGW